MRILNKQTLESTINTLTKLSTSLENSEQKHKMLMAGGIVPNKSKDIFIEYVTNGSIRLLKSIDSSLFGIMLKLSVESIESLNPDLIFYNLNTERLINKNLKVSELCIKLIPTHFDSKYVDYRLYSHHTDNKWASKLSSPVNDIICEIEIQNLIARSTNTYFEPACPFIFHSDLFLREETDNIIDLFLSSSYRISSQLTNILTDLKKILSNKNLGLSIIVMDLLNPINLSNKENKSDNAIVLRAYEFLRTIINPRIIPTDTHLGNFICAKSPEYIGSQNYPNRFYLIDFGQCMILKDELYNKIIKHYKNKNFFKLFMEIYFFAKSSNLNNLKYFIGLVTDVIFLDYKMNDLINDRNRRVGLLIKNEYFFKLTQKVNIINLEWTFSLYEKIGSKNNLFFQELLEESELSSDIATIIQKSKSIINVIINKFNFITLPNDSITISNDIDVPKFHSKMKQLINYERDKLYKKKQSILDTRNQIVNTQPVNDNNSGINILEQNNQNNQNNTLAQINPFDNSKLFYLKNLFFLLIILILANNMFYNKSIDINQEP